MEYKCVVCNKCDWIGFEVSREYAENEVKRFNVYFDTLSKEEQSLFGGKGASIGFYEHCFFCNGPYTNFRDATEADNKRADGHTLNPVINRNE